MNDLPHTPSMSDAADVLKRIMGFEPFLAGVIGAVVPGAGPVIALVQPEIMILAPFITKALEALSNGGSGDGIRAIIDLIQHITPGQPNSQILSDPLPPATA